MLQGPPAQKNPKAIKVKKKILHQSDDLLLLPRLTLILLLLLPSCLIFAADSPVIQVRIMGLSGELLKNAEIFLSIYQQKDQGISEGRIRRLHQKAKEEITLALQPFGYYRPTINSDIQHTDDGHWQATYTITPGPPLPVSTIDFRITGEGINDPEFKKLHSKLVLQPGRTLNHADYENTKTSLSRTAIERGYFDGRFVVHQINVDLNAYQADIVLHFDTGPRYHFGELIFQQHYIDTELLLKFSPFVAGDPYSNNDLVELQRALSDSDYFQTVEVHPLPRQTEELEVPIEIQLTARKLHKYTFGFGYGTDTGARGMLGWEVPVVNSHGHRFDSELRISEIGDSAKLRYRIPIFNPRTDQLIYSWGRTNEKTDTSTSLIYSTSAGMIYARGQWRENVALTYQQERYTVANVKDRTNLLIPSAGWSRVWARSRLQPRHGIGLQFELRGASQQLLSDIDFLQARTRAKAIMPLGPRGRLLLRGDAATTAVAPLETLPASVRFFAGGAQSVRGYAYQSLGPVNANGDVIGGKQLLVGSVEYDHNLANNISAALFYDAGNAIDKIDDPLKHGAGFGLRWNSPIGPVRIDLASALSLDGNPWRIHINIGPDL
jgi:translocation and assembly module TamA